jgi:hypothetical protein
MTYGKLIGLISKYGLGRNPASGETQCLRWETDKHTPWWNKDAHQKGKASIELTVCPEREDEPWVEFDVREGTTGPSGRIMSKVIHITMSLEDAKAFANHILTGTFKA